MVQSGCCTKRSSSKPKPNLKKRTQRPGRTRGGRSSACSLPSLPAENPLDAITEIGQGHLYVGIAVRDATDGSFIPAVSVGVTLIDEGGRVVGAREHSLVWDPLGHQYGRNWHVDSAGSHSMRVRVEPPIRAQAATEQAMRQIEVEFPSSTSRCRNNHPAAGGGAPFCPKAIRSSS